MRKSNPKARQFEPKCRSGGPAYATVQRSRTDPLALPKIQVGGATLKGSALEAKLALQWMDAGYIDESMVELTTQSLIETAFNRWIARNKGETPLFSDMLFSYKLVGPPDLEIDEDDYSDVEREVVDDKKAWHFSINSEHVGCRLLEPRFNEIEKRAPGLFQTAIATYQRVIFPITSPGTPDAIMSFYEQEMWMGNANQENVHEEMVVYSGMEEDEVDEVMLMPVTFRQGIPEWLLPPMPDKTEKPLHWDQQELSQLEVRDLANSADSEIATIAQRVLDLQALEEPIKNSNFGSDRGRCPLYPLVLLRWNESDNVRRAIDDIIERANQSLDFYTTEICSMYVGRTDKAFKKWRTNFDAVLQGLKIGHSLVESLSVPDDN